MYSTSFSTNLQIHKIWIAHGKNLQPKINISLIDIKFYKDSYCKAENEGTAGFLIHMGEPLKGQKDNSCQSLKALKFMVQNMLVLKQIP